MTQANYSSTLNNPFGMDVQVPATILVLGLGESGLAMARWCHAQGAIVKIHDTRTEHSLSDTAKQNIASLNAIGINQIQFGSNIDDSELDGVSIIAVSPGMSPLAEPISSLLTVATQKNIKVWGELEFFSQALANLRAEQHYSPKVLAITGTNGKTTTTALTGAICARAGLSVAVAGNISPSLLDKLMECLTTQTLPQVWVVELSSFQLFYSETFDPTAATVLNITQDHFDWHGDLAHYVAAKAKIFGPNTTAILNRDDQAVMSLLTEDALEKVRVITFGVDAPFEEDSFGIVGDMGVGGFDWLAWVEPNLEDNPGGKRKRRSKTSDEYAEPIRVKRLIPADALLIKGRHNAANALAALALAQAAGLTMGPLLHGLREYRGEPHRVQSIAIINDVEYIDDSKGTNVGATIAALIGLGMANGGGRAKLILIAGGDGKGQDFSPLLEPVRNYAKAVILIGKDAPLIQAAIEASGIQIIQATTLEDAVNEASNLAVSGDMVLLSPACASFDMFKDYAHRAEVFVNAVEELNMQSNMVGVDA